MKYTTIAITNEDKEKMKEFGMKGETYAEIVRRLIKSAEDRMLNDLLFNSEGFVPVKDALERAKKKWQ